MSPSIRAFPGRAARRKPICASSRPLGRRARCRAPQPFLKQAVIQKDRRCGVRCARRRGELKARSAAPEAKLTSSTRESNRRHGSHRAAVSEPLVRTQFLTPGHNVSHVRLSVFRPRVSRPSFATSNPDSSAPAASASRPDQARADGTVHPQRNLISPLASHADGTRKRARISPRAPPARRSSFESPGGDVRPAAIVVPQRAFSKVRIKFFYV